MASSKRKENSLGRLSVALQCRRDKIDVQHGTEGMVTDGGDDVTVSDTDEEQAGDIYEWKEPEFLTVGVIGQPNVGKSSLLNGIFGTTRVRASRTPGKVCGRPLLSLIFTPTPDHTTLRRKHFQTLFWTSDVRLVDCPGLVMPSFVPMDIQVLSGVLPISRVSAVPFCVHQLARLLPLEHILELTHPSLTSASDATADPGSISRPRKSTPKVKSASYPAPINATTEIEDKRTWRQGQRPLESTKVESKAPRWTANDIMTAYALKKGWVTAKAGRPDIHRAGNAILRLVTGRKDSMGILASRYYGFE
ncbi:hypothetical protein JVU11DRAFT_4844 [Chiua virens]|nr:hypothetical protein JVU11DRAFT_4844 [Chiua virens]